MGVCNVTLAIHHHFRLIRQKRVIHDVGLLKFLKRCVKYHTTRIANTLIHCFATKN